MTYPDGTVEAFTYDSAGNIRTYTSPAGTETREHDAADQLYLISGARSVWLDHNQRGQLVRERTGSVLGDRVRDYRFDSSGRLVAAYDNSTLILKAEYRDNYELRATTDAAGLKTTHQWALGNLLTSYGPTGVEQGFLLGLLGLDEPVERKSEAGVYETLLTDNLQSALAAYDDAGAVIRSTEFYAFGNVKSGAEPTAVGFHGARPFGGSTGLYQLRNRVYAPVLGRFLSRDTKGFAASYNHYAYGAGDPARFRDPSGPDIEGTIPSGIQEFRSTLTRTPRPLR